MSKTVLHIYTQALEAVLWKHVQSCIAIKLITFDLKHTHFLFHFGVKEEDLSNTSPRNWQEDLPSLWNYDDAWPE